VQLDGRVLLFAAVATVLAAIVAGVAPAAAARNRDLNTLLKASVGNSASARHTRLRSIFVIAQVAFSVLVLVCAGLFVRSARNAAHMDFGFRGDHLAMATTNWRPPGLDSLRARRLYQAILTRAASIAGVRSVALTEFLPFGFSRNNAPVYPIASTARVPVTGFNFFYNTVGGDYFATMGIPLLQGRAFAAADTAGAPQVAVVNDALAKALWPGEAAVGKRFHDRAADGPIVEVIGVVRGMQDLVPGETPHPYIFRPLGQIVPAEMTLLAFTSTDAAARIPSLRTAITAVNKQLPVFDARTMEEHLRNGQALLFRRLGSVFASAFGLLALVLATVGMYGVMSYGVAQRTREIGVRVALGARVPAILRLVVGQAMRLAWMGVALGLVLALAVTGALGSILYGVAPRDPLVLGGVIALVTLVAAAASLIPARRATRLDPVRTLRAE
jgi:predicted permease